MPTTSPTDLRTVTLTVRQIGLLRDLLDTEASNMRTFADSDDEISEILDLAAHLQTAKPVTHAGLPDADCPVCGPVIKEAQNTLDAEAEHPDSGAARIARRNALLAMQQTREQHYG